MGQVRNLNAASVGTSAVPMRPEFELLLGCVQYSKSGHSGEHVRALLQREIDWQYLVQLSRHHGMMPHLYVSLNESYASSVPQPVLRQLREHFHANLRRNFLFTAKLLKLLTLFQEQQIAAVPFKGPSLALAAYGDSALRQFTDLDILIRKEDVPKARELLISQGYSPQFALTDRQESDLIRFRNEHGFWHDAEGVAVDLHWALTPRSFQKTLDTEGLWSRITSATVAGRVVNAFSAEDMLLFLCVHGSKHCWLLLSMIYDLAAFLRASKAMNWHWLVCQARRQGTERMFLLGLHLARELFGAELPCEVVRRIEADLSVKRLAAHVYRILLREPAVAGGFFEVFLFNLRAIEGQRRKALYSFDQVITPTPLEWAFLPLPPALSSLYYLVRPARLLLKHRRGFANP